MPWAAAVIAVSPQAAAANRSLRMRSYRDAARGQSSRPRSRLLDRLELRILEAEQPIGLVEARHDDRFGAVHGALLLAVAVAEIVAGERRRHDHAQLAHDRRVAALLGHAAFRYCDRIDGAEIAQRAPVIRAAQALSAEEVDHRGVIVDKVF